MHQALRKNVPSAVVTARQTLFHPQSQHSVRTMVWDLARALQYEGTMGLNELKLKQEIYALAQSFIGLLIVGLVLVGIGGTIYKVISPDGWIALAFGRSLSAGAASLGSLIMIAGLAWFSRGWSSPRYRNRFSDLLVFSFAAAGLLYLSQLMLQGSF
ncbi:MAG TPA: hypothetical protein VN929_14810 [Burkholderiales bacterium]|nr:hypothetical protein [Burkholderiales bacterium]